MQVAPLAPGMLNFGMPTPRDAVAAMIGRACAGMNIIDTADGYNNGNSERVIGAVLAESRRSFRVAAHPRNMP